MEGGPRGVLLFLFKDVSRVGGRFQILMLDEPVLFSEVGVMLFVSNF